MKMDNRTNNDPQSTICTVEINDRATRTRLKTEIKQMCSKRVSSSCAPSVTAKRH